MPGAAQSTGSFVIMEGYARGLRGVIPGRAECGRSDLAGRNPAES
jgi:hypothetical protein